MVFIQYTMITRKWILRGKWIIIMIIVHDYEEMDINQWFLSQKNMGYKWI